LNCSTSEASIDNGAPHVKVMSRPIQSRLTYHALRGAAPTPRPATVRVGRDARRCWRLIQASGLPCNSQTPAIALVRPSFPTKRRQGQQRSCQLPAAMPRWAHHARWESWADKRVACQSSSTRCAEQRNQHKTPHVRQRDQAAQRQAQSAGPASWRYSGSSKTATLQLATSKRQNQHVEPTKCDANQQPGKYNRCDWPASRNSAPNILGPVWRLAAKQSADTAKLPASPIKPKHHIRRAAISPDEWLVRRPHSTAAANLP